MSAGNENNTCFHIHFAVLWSNPSFFSKRGRYDTESAGSVLDLILIYRVLHIKDMSFDKQGDGGTYEEDGPPLLTILGLGAWFCRQFWAPTGSILYFKNYIYSTAKI